MGYGWIWGCRPFLLFLVEYTGSFILTFHFACFCDYYCSVKGSWETVDVLVCSLKAGLPQQERDINTLMWKITEGQLLQKHLLQVDPTQQTCQTLAVFCLFCSLKRCNVCSSEDNSSAIALKWKWIHAVGHLNTIKIMAFNAPWGCSLETVVRENRSSERSRGIYWLGKSAQTNGQSTYFPPFSNAAVSPLPSHSPSLPRPSHSPPEPACGSLQSSRYCHLQFPKAEPITLTTRLSWVPGRNPHGSITISGVVSPATACSVN